MTGAKPGGERGVAKAPVVATAIVSLLFVALVAQAPWTSETAGMLTGAQAVPGLVQVALAGAAAGAFVAFADGIFRVLGGVLVLVAGVAAAVLSVRAGLAADAANAWPWVAFALAIAGSVAGAAVIALSGRWGRSSRRFSADAGAARRRDSVSDWDRLTRGDDPTRDESGR